ncbi:hypothetical protein BREVNS_0023 [Brevinematales bacterium NS]|nr:hypothetical protein BREVNS_0023 [Brevinematales bacterium NS]
MTGKAKRLCLGGKTIKYAGLILCLIPPLFATSVSNSANWSGYRKGSLLLSVAYPVIDFSMDAFFPLYVIPFPSIIWPGEGPWYRVYPGFEGIMMAKEPLAIGIALRSFFYTREGEYVNWKWRLTFSGIGSFLTCHGYATNLWNRNIGVDFYGGIGIFYQHIFTDFESPVVEKWYKDFFALYEWYFQPAFLFGQTWFFCPHYGIQTEIIFRLQHYERHGILDSTGMCHWLIQLGLVYLW